MPRITARPPNLEALFLHPFEAIVVELLHADDLYTVTHKWRTPVDDEDTWRIVSTRTFDDLTFAQLHWAKTLVSAIETHERKHTL